MEPTFMFKLSRELEYFIPLLLGMPLLVKLFFVIWAISTLIMMFKHYKSWPVRVWLIISIILAIVMASFTYVRNKGTILQEETYKLNIAKTQINRLIESYESSSKDIIEQFKDEIYQVGAWAANYGHGGAVYSKFMELPDKYSKKIDSEYRDFTRDVEDICLKNFNKKNVKDIPELKDEATKIDDLYGRLQTNKKSFEKQAQEAAVIYK
ncbi:MAG: hypothetical protein PHW62_05355 [Candidatus Ratteibacteria bacterium]|nr:hypothetical protein [Candidatus Ratteibacteria bacterium]